MRVFKDSSPVIPNLCGTRFKNGAGHSLGCRTTSFPQHFGPRSHTCEVFYSLISQDGTGFSVMVPPWQCTLDGKQGSSGKCGKGTTALSQGWQLFDDLLGPFKLYDFMWPVAFFHWAKALCFGMRIYFLKVYPLVVTDSNGSAHLIYEAEEPTLSKDVYVVTGPAWLNMKGT